MISLILHFYALCNIYTIAAGATDVTLVAGNRVGLRLYKDTLLIDQIISNFVSFPDEEMWSPIKVISPNEPLIFFYQRKSGGTSIRTQLRVAAAAANLTCYVPCQAGVPCEVYSFPPDRNDISIYTGHFNWGVQNVLERFGRGRRRQYSCMTNMREPISRIISCLNFRFRNKMRKRCIEDLSLEQLQELLQRPDNMGHSCLNEPFRALSGVLDEEIIDHVQDMTREMITSSDCAHTIRTNENTSSSGDNDGAGDSSISSSSSSNGDSNGRRRMFGSLSIGILNITLTHLQTCPPILLDLPQSFDAMNARLTTHKVFLTPPFSSSLRINSRKKQYCSAVNLASESPQLDLIREYAAAEIELYTVVRKKVSAYLRKTYGKFHS
jgi:hypothetical protein